MKEYFSIGEAARAAHTTSETLRHYDRIGLVTPSLKDGQTKYRYYTRQDIVRLTTVRALQQMDLPLEEIGRVLALDDLEQIVSYLDEADRKAEAKMAALAYSREKIQLAKADYERKLGERDKRGDAFVRVYPERVILLSDTLERPTLDSLHNYLSAFYDQIGPDGRERFLFEDEAGIYTAGGRARMYAVCARHEEAPGIVRLPQGQYLLADCGEEARERTLSGLLAQAEAESGKAPDFFLQKIVVTGILRWRYQIQAPLGGA